MSGLKKGVWLNAACDSGGGLVWHSVELVQSAEGAPIPGAAALWVSLACLVVNEAMFQVSAGRGKQIILHSMRRKEVSLSI